MTFATAVPISFTSFEYRTYVYCSIIHGIKRKRHLSVGWNWYHFVAIAVLHQPRPKDSADINTRLQRSDTSSIPLMHGGFLLIFTSRKAILDSFWNTVQYRLYWTILKRGRTHPPPCNQRIGHLAVEQMKVPNLEKREKTMHDNNTVWCNL